MISLTLLLSLFGCQSSEERSRQQEVIRLNREMADFCSRYNAVVDWPKEIKGVTFTIDAEPVFLRSDQRPILFYAVLEDVRRRNGSIFLYFRTAPTEGEPTLRLILDCDRCDVLEIKNSANALGGFGVLAQVTQAVRSLDDSEDAPEYLLHGKFIDARFVGDYIWMK
jgi:hypothetical protein